MIISCLNFRQGFDYNFLENWQRDRVDLLEHLKNPKAQPETQRASHLVDDWLAFSVQYVIFSGTQVRSLPSNFSQKYCINLFVMNSYFWQKTEDGWTYNSGRWNLHEYDLINNLDIYSLCQIYLNILLESNCEASFIFRARWAY